MLLPVDIVVVIFYVNFGQVVRILTAAATMCKTGGKIHKSTLRLSGEGDKLWNWWDKGEGY